MYCLHVVGARPNFMKAAPLIRALGFRKGIEQKLLHTGQHYNPSMSDVFFQELGIPEPDFNLAVGSGTHAQQTSRIMLRFEEIIVKENPDIVIVYGDVNSTIAAALVCSKLHLPVAHVEAGLRSFDRTMPEEINRVLTDQIADFLFTPSQDADENLLREGIPRERIHFVGNIMIDTLVNVRPRIGEADPGAVPDRYALVTLHRPSNVDDFDMLRNILNALSDISVDLPVIFPCHPRTLRKLKDIEFEPPEALRLCEPQSYLQFLRLQEGATLVITDSGGIQEETTFLGVPCLTLRDTTERPITVALGTNRLVGRRPERLHEEVRAVLAGRYNVGGIPPLWDGHCADRIADYLSNLARPACSARESQILVDVPTNRFPTN
jgi:UDP-N-acetylglucosamine 2-epimerase (non-hydrolysing)